MLQALWWLREEITASLLDDGYCYKYDISLPLQDYYKVVEVMRERLRPVTTRVVAYGHVGDGLSGILLNYLRWLELDTALSSACPTSGPCG